MQVTFIRQVVAIAVTGSGLLFGGASFSKYFGQSPAMLYAAGELHMAFGDARGGVELIERAEVARAALKQNGTPPSNIENAPAQHPVEVCTKQKRSANDQLPKLRPEPQTVMEAVSLPAVPAAPSVGGFELASFVPQVLPQPPQFDRHWRKNIHGVHVFNKVELTAEQQAALHQQRAAILEAEARTKVDVGAILKDVREQLASQNIPTTVMMVQGPTAD